MKTTDASCPGCGNKLPEPVMCSISHTIRPGELLCSECGQKETSNPAWADGRRRGLLRAKVGQEAMEE